MAPPKSASPSQASSDSETIAAAASPAAQTSARSSSVSLKALKRQLADHLSQRSLILAPSLSTDVAFTRNQVRNAYLRLLFHAPFTKAAYQAELGLWNETTHKIVGVYRARISKLAKEMKEQHPKTKQSIASRPSTPSSKDDARPAPSQQEKTSSAKHKAQSQEQSKLSEALRQFLAKEETFWKGLAERVAVVFRLRETQPALTRAGIALGGHKIPIGPKAIVGEAGQPAGLARLPTSHVELDQGVLRMAEFPRHKERLVEIVHRALVYCGDLSRYRELYRDDRSSLPPKKGSQQPAGSRKAFTPIGTPGSPQRSFEDAIACYEAARLLIPSNGNPSNQLALIATYSGDTFGAIYQYYRALCVKVPFGSAKINLGITLGKGVSDWIKEGGRSALNEFDAQSVIPASQGRQRQDCLKNFVALQGLFYTRTNFTSLQPLSLHFQQTFEAAVADRSLPTDMIVRILVTSIAASWSTRLWRKGDPKDRSRMQPSEGGSGSEDRPQLALTIELQLLDHVLAVTQTLFDVAASQSRIALENASPPHSDPAKRPSADEEKSAARNLTPVLRRILPAMRIASKWVKAHLDYIDRSQQSCISHAAEGFAALKTQSQNTEAVASAAAGLALIQRVEHFWTSFTLCINTLRYTFPFDALPNLGAVRPTGAAPLALEEDTDLRGFIPTRRGMLTQNDTALKSADRELHPNEEQLMRIADLLVDAKVIAESAGSPVVFDDTKGTFILDSSAKRNSRPQKDSSHIWPQTFQSQGACAIDDAMPAATHGDIEDSGSIGTSEATEDIVDLVMRARDASDGQSQDVDASEDEDEILIPTAIRSGQPKAHGQSQNRNIQAPAYQSSQNSLSRLSGLGEALVSPTRNDNGYTGVSIVPPSLATPAAVGPSQSGEASLNSPLPLVASATTAQDLFLQMLNGRPMATRKLGKSDSTSGLATPPARELSNGTSALSSLSTKASALESPGNRQELSLTHPSHFLFSGGLGAGGTVADTPAHHGPSMAGLASIWSPGPGEVRHQYQQQSSPRASIGEGEKLWNAAPGSAAGVMPLPASTGGGTAGFASPSSLQQQQHFRQGQQWQASPSQRAHMDPSMNRGGSPATQGWPSQQRG